MGIADPTCKNQTPLDPEPPLPTTFSSLQICMSWMLFVWVWLAFLPTKAKDIVFRFVIESSSLRDFYRPLGNIAWSILIREFSKDDILACVET
jgi:hypothetical protein